MGKEKQQHSFLRWGPKLHEEAECVHPSFSVSDCGCSVTCCLNFLLLWAIPLTMWKNKAILLKCFQNIVSQQQEGLTKTVYKDLNFVYKDLNFDGLSQQSHCTNFLWQQHT